MTRTGTTIVGLRCVDGVVLGADTKATGGVIVADKGTHKIHQLDSSIFCCGSGTSADCAMASRDAAIELLRLKFDRYVCGDTDFQKATSTAARILAEKCNLPIGGREKSCGFIVGGIDSSGPRLFMVNTGEDVDETNFAALGSGGADAMSSLEYSLLMISKHNKTYQNICAEEAVPIVRKSVLQGIKNDLGSGCHVDLMVISRNGSVVTWREELIPQRKKHSTNELVNSQFFKKIFRSDGDQTLGSEVRTNGASMLDECSKNIKPENFSDFSRENIIQMKIPFLNFL
jgi:20S proteasome subunit beta 2